MNIWYLKKRRTSRFLQKGFSLIELAIVLVVVALLLGGLLVPLTMQIEQQKIRETQKSMEEIKDALVGFALANGRFPCPASPAIPTGQVNAGVETLTCASPNNFGVLPWVTLGVREGDAWGRRYTYYVTPNFADPIAANTVTPPSTCVDTPLSSSFALCSTANGSVRNSTASGAQNIASNVPIILVSHGKNGYGGYQELTGIKISISSAGGDETENANADNIFVSRTQTAVPDSPCNDTGSPLCEFDDLVTWLSPNILFNRMVAAGRLP